MAAPHLLVASLALSKRARNPTLLRVLAILTVLLFAVRWWLYYPFIWLGVLLVAALMSSQRERHQSPANPRLKSERVLNP